jgi:DNA-binding XRE family transcriptional regulator
MEVKMKRSRYKPKNDPFAKQLYDLRVKLGEDQTKYAARFSVGRTTMGNWERWGPPEYGPVRLHAVEVFRKIEKMLKMRRKRADAKAKAR